MPQDKVYDERLKAAAAGLPTAAASGYSLLDKMGVTSSEFQQSVTYKRALEGELANTISAMNGVKTASVKLAIPEKTVFVSKAPDPTASVFIETDAGATLTGDQVQAIVHLTSASIENMKPANVSVVDSAGQRALRRRRRDRGIVRPSRPPTTSSAPRTPSRPCSTAWSARATPRSPSPPT